MMETSTINNMKTRDPRWLRLEVCRDFIREDSCDRGVDQCRFAHPDKSCLITNGKVTACYDSMKGRCNRDKCKFFHPPDHIKKYIQALGKAFEQQRLIEEQNADYCGWLHMPLQVPGQNQFPALLLNAGKAQQSRRADNSDRLPICAFFVCQSCKKKAEDCQFAHPPPTVHVDPDGFVTVCMDFIADHCTRDNCKYFHPPTHLKARVKAVQIRQTPASQQLQTDEDQIPLPLLTSNSLPPMFQGNGAVQFTQQMMPPLLCAARAAPLLLYSVPTPLGQLTYPVHDPMVKEPKASFVPIPFAQR